MENPWNNLPLTADGAFDFETLLEQCCTQFWKKHLEIRKKFHTVSLAKMSDTPHGAFEPSALLLSIEQWLTGKENSSDVDIGIFLYSGDPILKERYGYGDSNVTGITTLIARNIMRSKMLRSLFYHYCRKYAETQTPNGMGTIQDRYAFANLLVENVRAMLADIWITADNRLCHEFKDFSISDFILLIEFLFLDYDKLKSPVKKKRLLRLVQDQNALPLVEEIRERVELLKSFSENNIKNALSVKKSSAEEDLSNRVIYDQLVRSFAPYWTQNIQVRGISLEEPSRMNLEIRNVLETLTTAEIRDAESMKNEESGALGRQIKKELSTENAAASPAALERLDLLRKRHVSIDQCNDDGISLADQLPARCDESIYCPDDCSEKVWKRLSKEEKMFLITTLICNEQDTSCGYKGMLQKVLHCKISYLGDNIFRIMAEEIYHEKFPEITGKNKQCVIDAILRFIAENGDFQDISYTLNCIFHDRISSIRNNSEDPEHSLILEAEKIKKMLQQKKGF